MTEPEANRDTAPDRTKGASSAQQISGLIWLLLFPALAVLAWFAYGMVNRRIGWGDAATWVAAFGGISAFFVATYQLRLQRKQLADQEQVIADEYGRQAQRDELIDVQLRQAKTAARALERQQANQVDLRFRKTADTNDDGDVFHRPTAVVANHSNRPIYNVTWQAETRSGELRRASRVGNWFEWKAASGLSDEVLVDIETETKTLHVIRRGEAFGFNFDPSDDFEADPPMSADFTDDARTRWHIDSTLNLSQVDEER